METVQILLTRRRAIGSLAIRAFTWSPFSHVEVVDGGEVIGASMGAGVHTLPLAKRLELSSYAALLEAPHPEPVAVIAAMRSQIGKPYDYAALFGLVARQSALNEHKAWFCSELVAWAFAATGRSLFRQELSGRIVPQDFWKLPVSERHTSRPLDLLAAHP